MKVMVPTFRKSTSRNVNTYIRARLVRQALKTELELAMRDCNIAYEKLTGGQLAEAHRILEEVAMGVPA